MKCKIIVPLLILSMLLLGCAPEIEIPTTDDTGATAEGVAELVKANNQFGLDIYSRVSQEPGNVFISPWSLASALSMTYEGARGQTADEMKEVMHLPDAETRHSSFAKLFNDINKKDKEYQLYTANALWAQKDYSFLPEYLGVVERYYGGKATNVDFAGNTEQARVTINNWVEDYTNNKIKDLFEPGVLKPATRLVLTNAIYFKGTWLKQFKKSDTFDADFRISPEKTVTVPMMSMHEKEFNYYQDDKLQILELPYDGEDLSMLVLLPKNDDLAAVESMLSADKLSEWNQKLRETTLGVYLPKFTFETKYSLSDTLSAMGMPAAFSEDADFSGMDGSQMLYISSVVHQAFVEVNEEGTEAAAATGVVMTLKEAMSQTFRADHPFIFLIQERNSGNILFLGRIVDPS